MITKLVFVSLVVFHPLVFYQELTLRPYAILIPLVLFQATFFIRLLRKWYFRDVLLFMLLSVMAIFSHYLVVGLIAVQFLVLVITNKNKWKSVLFYGGVTVLPLVFWFLGQGGEGLTRTNAIITTYNQLNITYPEVDTFYSRFTFFNLFERTIQNILYSLGIGLQDIGIRSLFLMPMILLLFLGVFRSIVLNRKKFLCVTTFVFFGSHVFLILLAFRSGLVTSLSSIYYLTFFIYGPLLLSQYLDTSKKRISRIVLVFLGLSSVYFQIGTNKYDSISSDLPILSHQIEKLNDILETNNKLVFSNWDDAQFASLFLENEHIFVYVKKEINTGTFWLETNHSNKVFYYRLPAKTYENHLQSLKE